LLTAWNHAIRCGFDIESACALLLLIRWSTVRSRHAPLLAEVIGVGPGKSLENKVRLAQTYYAVPDIQTTCAVLADFVSEVRAQRGKKITPVVADKLIVDAQAIMTAIGCN
jgi:hypothetical protein